MEEIKMKLETIKKQLKKCLVLQANKEIIDKQYKKIRDNRLAKLGYSLYRWRDYTKKQQENILNVEAEVEQEIKEKFGMNPFEASEVLTDAKQLFNDVALDYALKHLANKKQIEVLQELKIMDETNKIIYRDRLFNINSTYPILILL